MVGLAALTVLGAGVLVVRQEPAPAPVPQVTDGRPQPRVLVGSSRVGGEVRLDEERPLVTRLALDVVVSDAAPGRGDSGGSPEPTPLRLVDVTGRGFQVRLLGGGYPLTLGEFGRFGSGLRTVIPLGLEVVVADCSVDVGAQRRLTLVLRSADGPVATVDAQSNPAVTRALDDLVRRSCRRPRG